MFRSVARGPATPSGLTLHACVAAASRASLASAWMRPLLLRGRAERFPAPVGAGPELPCGRFSLLAPCCFSRRLLFCSHSNRLGVSRGLSVPGPVLVRLLRGASLSLRSCRLALACPRRAELPLLPNPGRLFSPCFCSGAESFPPRECPAGPLLPRRWLLATTGVHSTSSRLRRSGGIPRCALRPPRDVQVIGELISSHGPDTTSRACRPLSARPRAPAAWRPLTVDWSCCPAFMPLWPGRSETVCTLEPVTCGLGNWRENKGMLVAKPGRPISWLPSRTRAAGRPGRGAPISLRVAQSLGSRGTAVAPVRPVKTDSGSRSFPPAPAAATLLRVPWSVLAVCL